MNVELSLGTVLAISVIALAAPIIVSLGPGLRLPAVVLEIVLGIIVGPSGLDWIEVDASTEVLSLLGLGFLLFLAGLEIDPLKLRHGIGRILVGFALSVAIAVGVGFVAELLHATSDPLFVGIALASTSLGLLVPVLRDAGQTDSEFGQLMLSSAAVAEFGTIVLVSLLYSQNSSSTGSTVLLIAAFAVLALVIGVALSRAGRSIRVSGTLVRLEETTAQLGVRIAIVLLGIFFVLASDLGLETILGAFVAGSLLRVVDRDERLIHDRFRAKIEAIGYGFLVPIFFVASGLRFDADALFEEPERLLLVPIFLVGILAARGLPVLLLRSVIGRERVVPGALLQATTLTFVVVASHLGTELDVFDSATGAALIVSGLLSVVLFPAIALRLLGSTGTG